MTVGYCDVMRQNQAKILGAKKTLQNVLSSPMAKFTLFIFKGRPRLRTQHILSVPPWGKIDLLIYLIRQLMDISPLLFSAYLQTKVHLSCGLPQLILKTNFASLADCTWGSN